MKFQVGDTVINRIGEVGKVTGFGEDFRHPVNVRFDNRSYTVSEKGQYYCNDEELDDDDVRLLTKLERALK